LLLLLIHFSGAPNSAATGGSLAHAQRVTDPIQAHCGFLLDQRGQDSFLQSLSWLPLAILRGSLDPGP
jgi:hypothetical protein